MSYRLVCLGSSEQSGQVRRASQPLALDRVELDVAPSLKQTFADYGAELVGVWHPITVGEGGSFPKGTVRPLSEAQYFVLEGEIAREQAAAIAAAAGFELVDFRTILTHEEEMAAGAQGVREGLESLADISAAID